MNKNRKYPYNRSEASKEVNRNYYRNLRKATLEIFESQCNKCGFDDVRTLQVDHVNGGGLKERKQQTATYWSIIIKSVLNKENKYQLLCANCNWIKRFENKEHRKRLVA